MLRHSLVTHLSIRSRWILPAVGRPPTRSVVKDSKYYLQLAKERGIILPGGFKYGEKPLLPGERRVIPFGDRIITWGMWFSLFLLYFLAGIRPKNSWEIGVEKQAIEKYETLLLEAGIEDLTIEEEY